MLLRKARALLTRQSEYSRLRTVSYYVSLTLDLDCYEALSLDRHVPLRTNIFVTVIRSRLADTYLGR